MMLKSIATGVSLFAIAIAISCKGDKKEDVILFVEEKRADSTLSEMGMKVNGMKTGLWVYFRNDGSLLSRDYYWRGLREGPHTMWDKNRDTMFLATYHKGKLDAPSVHYSDGILGYKGYYREGKQHGDWEFYYEGRLARKVKFDRGRVVKREDIGWMPPALKFGEIK